MRGIVFEERRFGDVQHHTRYRVDGGQCAVVDSGGELEGEPAVESRDEFHGQVAVDRDRKLMAGYG